VAESRCLVTNVILNSENNSDAHIIPSALGGRLKPRNLLSREGNALLNEKFDAPLVEAYRPLMAVVDGSRDSGETPGVRVRNESNQTMILKGRSVRLAPKVAKLPGPNGPELHVVAPSEKDMKNMLGGKLAADAVREIMAKHPHLDIADVRFKIDEAVRKGLEQLVEQAESVPSEQMTVELRFGPGISFPAAYVMISLFAAHHGLHRDAVFERFVTAFRPFAKDLPAPVFYFMPPVPCFTIDAELGHMVLLVGSAERKQMFGFVSLFGVEEIAVLLPYEGCSDTQRSYGVDILTGREANVSIDVPRLNQANWSATHEPSDCANELKTRLARIRTIANKRMAG
jgi:hypothetical protein